MMKLKTERVPVYEETTVNGITERTPTGEFKEVTTSEPVPPRNMRAEVRLWMFRIAVGFTALAMAISMAAIGKLFTEVVPWFVAFPGAAVFDGLWIYALMGEWLSQTKPRARKAAQKAGIGFVAASMAAIVLEAYLMGHLAVGIALAFIPLGVKAAWWLRLETTTHRLSPAYLKRLEKIEDQVHTELAVEELQRELDAARALTADLRTARGLSAPAVTVERETPAGEPTAPELTPIRGGSGAIRIADPGGSVKDRVRALYESGVTGPEDIVSALRDANPETVKRMVRLVRTEGGYA